MRTILLIILAAFIAGGGAWFGRGIYDRIYMLEGYFMVVNMTPEDHDVRVRFPSGRSHEGRISSRGSHTFRVRNTGEGGVSVFLDGTEITHKENGCGYVTGINSPKVLVVQSDKVTMINYYADLTLDYIEDGGLSK